MDDLPLDAKADELARKATQAQQRGDYAGAVVLFRQAADLLEMAVRATPAERSRTLSLLMVNAATYRFMSGDLEATRILTRRYLTSNPPRGAVPVLRELLERSLRGPHA